MYIDNNLFKDIQNLTTSTIANGHNPLSNDDNDMTRILSYAIPLSCVVIVMVLLVATGINRRQRVLEKWTSLKRMRNTNPRCINDSVLRRDSEYDLCTDSLENMTIANEDRQNHQEHEFRMATIS
ncbi:unnamed protein product [Rotaria socialis]|uniref:Uncharacterized protein n=1 Tax=Rotaria socialis TaxID=392032 RepID=A0A818EZI7_9BILA|nr:unnamed protein product [Rotaria socialis]CAF3516496.1 unnamed protein product [Rotaria socialis]CAF3785758.1 unnamed protein product [Rotaria socialis]CAF4218542.1 unnamed protein product [Rotaria socialis]CAF4286769.1 unnamed protein product [Rotaria socialis]